MSPVHPAAGDVSSLERRTRSLRAAGDPARAMVGDVSGARSPSGARGVAPSIRAGRSDADPNVDPLSQNQICFRFRVCYNSPWVVISYSISFTNFTRKISVIRRINARAFYMFRSRERRIEKVRRKEVYFVTEACAGISM